MDLLLLWQYRELIVVSTPTLQKPEGFRVKASKGEVVVFYFESLATQDLKFSGFPEGYNNMAKKMSSFEYTSRQIQ